MICLVIVATGQVASATFGVLSPWKGGGFGMFASFDSVSSRYLVCTAVMEDGSEHPIANAPRGALRQAVFTNPSEYHLRQVAEYLSEKQRPEALRAIRVEVLRKVLSGLELRTQLWATYQHELSLP